MHLLARSILVFGLALTASAGWASENDAYMIPENPRRLALVIGNADYTELSRLPSAKLDAKTMRQKLKELDFDVVNDVEFVQTADEWEEKILPYFRSKIKGGDFVVVFYSGHGFAYGPDTFLAPLKMPKVIRARTITDHAVALGSIEYYLLKKSPGMLFFILDSCRSIGDFIIKDDEGRVEGVTKGPAAVLEPSRDGNVLTAFATRQGYPAIGSVSDEKLSYFTEAVVEHIGEEDSEVHVVFNKIGNQVKRATNRDQHPGLYDWSDSDLYISASTRIIEEQMRAWKAALSTRRVQDIENFIALHSVSPFASAARRWLNDRTNDALTFVSPVAIERAWRPDSDSRVAIRRLQAPFALERVADLDADFALTEASDAELGLVPSGTTAAALTRWAQEPSMELPSSGSFNVGAVEVHGRMVLSSAVSGRAVADPSAPITTTLPAGTQVEVLHSERGPTGRTWIKAVEATGEVVALATRETLSTAPLEVGSSLLEIMVSPRDEGSLTDLIDGTSIVESIAALRAQGRRITWVSLATGKGPKQPRVLQARLTHARYVLISNGVDGRQITGVINVDDVPKDRVRVRIFGY